MPINILYTLFVIALITLLVINVVLPLFVPRYKMFWLFRKDRYFDAVENYNESRKTRETEDIIEHAAQESKEESMEIRALTKSEKGEKS